MTDELDKLYFIDVETTGLSVRSGHRPWEIGIVSADGNVVLHKMWKPSKTVMQSADAMALKMNKFYERINSPSTHDLRKDGEEYTAGRVAEILNGATLCGAAIHFDMGMIEAWLWDHGHIATWSHRPIDIESYVAGKTDHLLPESLSNTAKRAGVAYEKEKKHTALYDAELARRCYMAVSFHDENFEKEFAPEMPKPPKMGSDE